VKVISSARGTGRGKSPSSSKISEKEKRSEEILLHLVSDRESKGKCFRKHFSAKSFFLEKWRDALPTPIPRRIFLSGTVLPPIHGYYDVKGGEVLGFSI